MVIISWLFFLNVVGGKVHHAMAIVSSKIIEHSLNFVGNIWLIRSCANAPKLWIVWEREFLPLKEALEYDDNTEVQCLYQMFVLAKCKSHFDVQYYSSCRSIK